MKQRADDGRVELRAGVARKLQAGVLDVHRLAVRAVAGHRVEGVADQHDAAGQRDLAGLQAVGVAAAVPALVLVADRAGDLFKAGHGHDDALADHRVLLHHFPLLVVELARLVQDLVGDSDLADVVQQRDVGDVLTGVCRSDAVRRRSRCTSQSVSCECDPV